jgi:glutamine amidotransferase
VRRGIEHCGATVEVTDDPEIILAAPRVVLPGVGAFADGMGELQRRGLDTVVQTVAGSGVPLLGICLGMQMLLDESEEFGTTRGLGIIPGRVIAVPTVRQDGGTQKVPHLGWSSLALPPGRTDWKGTLLAEVAPGDAVYFVHSFMASPNKPEDRIADAIYGGVLVSAAVGARNVFGVQFHPEKSGEVGLRVLRQFLAWEPVNPYPGESSAVAFLSD